MLHNVINRETLENKKCLVICPSRERVIKLMEMVKSFKDKTSPQTALLVCLDDDDPMIEEYKELLGISVAYHVGRRNTITNLFNEMFRLFPSYEYYALTNDDFVYLTAVWDVKLMGDIKEMGGWGIAYGDDRLAHDKYPSHTVISGNGPPPVVTSCTVIHIKCGSSVKAHAILDGLGVKRLGHIHVIDISPATGTDLISCRGDGVYGGGGGTQCIRANSGFVNGREI